MKIIILEGIATSGKTSLKEELREYFNNTKLDIKVIDEEITLMPILNNSDRDVSLELLERVINSALREKVDVIIFDRLYFTHIFRTKSTLADFSMIEKLLFPYHTLLVLLTVKKELIGQRIFEAMKHRDESWKSFVRKKGTDDEIIDYYRNQQEDLIKLVNNSKLESIILDATSRDYDTMKDSVLKCLTNVSSCKHVPTDPATS